MPVLEPPTDNWVRASEVQLPAIVTTAHPAGESHVLAADRIALPAPVRCSECNGAGFLLEAVPFGHPHFGKLFPCRCKITAHVKKRTAELARLSNLAAVAEQTFATFDPDQPGLRRAYLRAREFARAPVGWLLLFGPSGVGKTHLAAAAAQQVLARGEQVLFTIVPDLLDHLRATFGPSSEIAYDERFEIIRSVSLLVLDDLGTESATPWAREKLYQIINHRYNERLPTVMTSNRTLESLEPRTHSRMQQLAFAGEILQITAEDYRCRATARQGYTSGTHGTSIVISEKGTTP